MKYIILKGGLGNQLFQLSYFLYLNENDNFKDLKIDIITGFLLDFKYNRNLEIKSLLNSQYKCSVIESILNSILLILNKLIPKIINKFPVLYVNDNNYFQIDKIKQLDYKYIIFDGYFQNSIIVDKSLNNLYKSINQDLTKSVSLKFSKLYEEIKAKENSVALCIRFYEESSDPRKHSNALIGEKSLNDFNNVISSLENKLNSPFFYVFVQENNKFTERLVINSPHKFITHAKGYNGSWERLIAQSYCQHHIFNNSTFYYWGSELAKFFKVNRLKSIKIVSNNFIFKEIYRKGWEIF